MAGLPVDTDDVKPELYSPGLRHASVTAITEVDPPPLPAIPMS